MRALSGTMLRSRLSRLLIAIDMTAAAGNRDRPMDRGIPKRPADGGIAGSGDLIWYVERRWSKREQT